MYIVGALAALFFLGNLIGKAGSLITMPFYGVRHWFAESSALLPSYLRTKAELIDEIGSLKERLSAYGGTDATIAHMVRENEELRSLLSVKESDRIAAAVSARPPFLPYDAILIDRGSADGIIQNAIVYHAHDQAIGFVAKVFTHNALVTLFSTPGVTATAYVIGPDIYTTMHGEGGGIMSVTIPQGITLSQNDVVVLPSLEVGIIGTVQDIETAPTQPVQYGYIVPEIPIQSLNLVSVSKRTPQNVTYEEAERIIKETRQQSLMIDIPSDVSTDGVRGNASSSKVNSNEHSSE